ncbi:MAG: hypothetical protein LBD35_07735, partial [Prevotellaceae bacterium]|nr:hypothetical protein [Prevotellaceae bacterium]
FRSEEARFYDLEDPASGAFAGLLSSNDARSEGNNITIASRMNNDFPDNSVEFDISPPTGDAPF